jgi:hypothetical protein
VFDIPIYRGYFTNIAFIREKTTNPFMYSILISFVVCVVGFSIPIGMMLQSSVLNIGTKEVKSTHIKFKSIISKALNFGKQGILQAVSIVIIVTFGSVGIVYLISSIDYVNDAYEFLFWSDLGDDMRETNYDFSLYREKYNDTNRFCAINTSTGLSVQDVNEISNNEYVQSVEAVLTDKTARFYINKTSENATILDTLEGYDIKSVVQSGCESLGLDFEQSWEDYNQYYESYGFNDSTTNYYYTSVVACNDSIFNQLEEYLVDGEIDVEGIQNGEKVLIIDGGSTLNTCGNPFNVGDTIHLFNTYFANEDDWKSVSETDFSYYIDTQVSFKDVEVCGIIQIPDGNLQQTLLVQDYTFSNNYTLITTLDGYSNWNFAQTNYDRVNIELKSSNDSLKFQEKVLPNYITSQTGMSIISLASGYKKINQEIGKLLVQLITMVTLSIVIFIIGYVNTIKLQLKLNQKRFSILQSLGMSKKKLMLNILKENIKVPIVSTIISSVLYLVLKLGYTQFYNSIKQIINDDTLAGESDIVQNAIVKFTQYQLYLQLQDYNAWLYIAILSLVVYLLSVIVSVSMYKKNTSNIIDTIRKEDF